MKKIVLTSAIALLTIGAFAQTTTPQTDKQKDMKDMRKDMRDVRKDEKARKVELKEGDKKEAKELTKDIRQDKKEMKSDAKDLRKDGVKHPIRRAHRQIKRH